MIQTPPRAFRVVLIVKIQIVNQIHVIAEFDLANVRTELMRRIHRYVSTAVETAVCRVVHDSNPFAQPVPQPYPAKLLKLLFTHPAHYEIFA